MSFVTDIGQQELVIDSVYPENTSALVDLKNFYAQWQNSSNAVYAYSSGSTGIPKKIALNKKAMIQSAIMTCSFLQIPQSVTTLLCMPLRFIGARMVVVRALVSKLRIVISEPSSHPLHGLDKSPYFAAMTPSQIISSLESAKERELLSDIKVLLIGGGAIDTDLQETLKTFKNQIFSTYGMTETLSHIALRRLSGHPESGYRPFEQVTVQQAPDGTAVISCPPIGVNNLKTNDIIKFNADNTFTLVGRLDNVINSGGIKIQIETAETILKDILDFDFNITAVPDHKLGQKAVLLGIKEVSEQLIRQCHDALPKYWAPKTYLRVNSLPKTLSGKPDRKALGQIASNMLKK